MFPDNKPKKKPLSNSSEVLHGLFENGKSALSEQFLRWKLWKKWPDFVGPTIGAISEPVGYKRGVLYLWVKNASWMQQLIFMLDPLKDSINKKLEMNFVRTIHLTMDRKAVPKDVEQQLELRTSIANLMSEGDE